MMDKFVDVAERVVGLLALIFGVGGPAGYLLARRQQAADVDKTRAEGGKAEAEGFSMLAAARKIDAETLALFHAIYQEMVKDLERKVEGLEKEVVDLRAEGAEMRAENLTMRMKVAKLEGEVAERDDRIAHLEQLVAALQDDEE